MTTRLIAAGLAMIGAASGIPLALAQLDFAGAFNVFNVDSGDAPHALVVWAGIAGGLTLAVAAATLVGGALAAVGSRSARPTLIAAAIAGFATTMPVWMLWIPTAVVIGAAVALLGSSGRTSPATAT